MRIIVRLSLYQGTTLGSLKGGLLALLGQLA